MRGFAFSALIVTGVIAICSGCQKNPGNSDAARVNDAEAEWERFTKQLDMRDDQIERTDEMIDRWVEQNYPYEIIFPPLEITLADPFGIILDHSEEITLDRSEIIFDRSEEYSDPFGMILLDKWEKHSPLQEGATALIHPGTL